MPNFAFAHAQDNEIDQTRTEVVGSTSLKDVLIEHGTIRGTWWLNRYEFRNFEATSPAHVTTFINDATKKTGVTASIDDGFHLVLTNNSSAPIAVSSGYALDRDRQRAAIEARNKSQGNPDRKVEDSELDDRPDILSLLGLTATDDVAAARGEDWKPGATADDRQKAEAQRLAAASGEPSSPMFGGTGEPPLAPHTAGHIA